MLLLGGVVLLLGGAGLLVYHAFTAAQVPNFTQTAASITAIRQKAIIHTTLGYVLSLAGLGMAISSVMQLRKKQHEKSSKLTLDFSKHNQQNQK
jgi:hypothetical protein